MTTHRPKRKAKGTKLTDAERHARFVETARKVGASEDPKDFEKALTKILGKKVGGRNAW
jgi:hypothetical protein